MQIGSNSLDGYVVERGGRSSAASTGEQICKAGLAPQLVDCGTFDSAPDGDLRPYGRDDESVASFEPIIVRICAMKEEVVQIDVTNVLLAPIVLERAKRADCSGTASSMRQA